MRFRKTPDSKRDTLEYHYEEWNDDCKCYVTTVCTIEENEDTGVTKDIIHFIHRSCDREVENNCRQLHRPLTEKEKAEKREWEATHPGEKYPMPYNCSLDYLTSDNCTNDSPDKSLIQSLSAADPFCEEPDSEEIEKLHYLMNQVMSDKQKEILCLAVYEGLTLPEIAEKLNCSHETVREHFQKALQCLRNNWELFSPYFPHAEEAMSKHLNLRSLSRFIHSGEK